jgi:hypothetical protein
VRREDRRRAHDPLARICLDQRDDRLLRPVDAGEDRAAAVRDAVERLRLGLELLGEHRPAPDLHAVAQPAEHEEIAVEDEPGVAGPQTGVVEPGRRGAAAGGEPVRDGRPADHDLAPWASGRAASGLAFDRLIDL